MDGIRYIASFLEHSTQLFEALKEEVIWDERMKSRKTASFGVAYNYSQIRYEQSPFLPSIDLIRKHIASALEFTPNNCLINFYPDGKSKMGFHSDQTDILEDGTGVAIVSLGAERILRFRNISDQSIVHDFTLASGSLFYMNNEVQEKWQHALPQSELLGGRMSLSFRKLKTVR